MKNEAISIFYDLPNTCSVPTNHSLVGASDTKQGVGIQACFIGYNKKIIIFIGR